MKRLSPRQCSDCCKSSDSDKAPEVDTAAPRRLRRNIKEPAKFSPSIASEPKVDFVWLYLLPYLYFKLKNCVEILDLPLTSASTVCVHSRLTTLTFFYTNTNRVSSNVQQITFDHYSCLADYCRSSISTVHIRMYLFLVNGLFT